MFDTLKEAKAWVREHSWVTYEIQKRPYTYVVVGATGPTGMEQWFKANAFAKCKPGDEWSEELGVAIATGKAQAEIACMLVRPAGPTSTELELQAIAEHVANPNAEAREQYLNSKVTLECPKCGHRVKRAVRFTLNHCLCSEPPVPMHRARASQDDISGALTSTELQANPNADPGRGWKVVDANEAEAALQAAMQRDA